MFRRLMPLLAVLLMLPIVLACGFPPRPPIPPQPPLPPQPPIPVFRPFQLPSLQSFFSATKQDTFPVGEEAEVSVELEAGRLAIVGNEGRHIEIHSVLLRPTRTDYQVEHSGNRVAVKARTRSNASGISRSAPVQIVITLPKNARVTVVSRTAEVQLDALSGDIKVTNGTGEIEAVGMEGNIVLETQTGNIRLGSAGGNIRAESSTGNLDLMDVQGTVSAVTNNGNVRFEGRLISEGNHFFESRTGNINLRLWETPDVTVEAESRTGTVNCPSEMTISSQDRRSCAGTLGDAIGSIVARSRTGNVRILLAR